MNQDRWADFRYQKPFREALAPRMEMCPRRRARGKAGPGWNEGRERGRFGCQSWSILPSVSPQAFCYIIISSSYCMIAISITASHSINYGVRSTRSTGKH